MRSRRFFFDWAALCARLTVVVCLQAQFACAWAASEVAYTVREPDLVPEGIAFDKRTGAFFLGSTYKRKIVRIDSAGNVSDFTQPAAHGLWGVLGMQVDAQRRHLWAIASHAGNGMPMQNMTPGDEGSSAVFKFDLESGALIKKYLLTPDPDRHFLNDLVVSASGDVFISDSGASTIYTIARERDTLEMFLALGDAGSPNGITLSDDERYLFVALWDGGDVGRIEVASRQLSLLAMPQDVEVHADGLYFFENSLVSIEPFETSKVVNRYFLDSNAERVVRHVILEKDHASLAQPTTGVIVDDELHYIANSQLQIFRRLYAAYGDDYPLTDLKDVVVLRTPL